MATRSVDMTVPVDVATGLFPDAYAAGVRVHVNAWGCQVPTDEDASYCGNYTAQAGLISASRMNFIT